MALDRQISLFKVDTNAFLTEAEKQKQSYLLKMRNIRSKIYKQVSHREKTPDLTFKKLKAVNYYDLPQPERCFIDVTEVIKEEEKNWKSFLLKSAKENVAYNDSHPEAKRIRQLDERYLSYPDKVTGECKVNISNVISMFESTLSRSFGIAQNELTYDIFVMEIYYYDIAKDVILNGFDYNGQHYVYFSSSAGQIRTKKAVFVNESKFEKCKMKLMCGLTVDEINAHGGMNINKYLAYLALSNSATDLWQDALGVPFDIDRCIVAQDFETLVPCKVDHIDYVTYDIKSGVNMNIPIPHTDGCGMILPELSNKNFMVRLPFLKGLLGVFDFRQFVYENLSDTCNGDIVDAWGQKHNIFAEDIQVIFTASQLKMWKYYKSWDDYKENFKRYNCEAGVCNMEEHNIPDAKINYQMLQTLYDATDEEIAELCELPNRRIDDISSSLANMLDLCGVRLDDTDERGKDWFQKSLRIYPELIVDPGTKKMLTDLRRSYKKKYKGGHLDVKGKFTFVLPDLYAFCEWAFCNIAVPNGLLADNEVYCALYEDVEELDCLRSPHLYIEHAIRKNVCKKEPLSYWFTTDAIYTSTHDPISRILQFDVDGDRLLVLAQQRIIEMAKRVTKDVYPLYYEMKKANAEEINQHNIYNGLLLAFSGGRIGPISNDITKIWNSENIDEQAKNAVKWLCMETNFTIDYAKTLFKPTRPDHVDEILKQYGRQKVPFFFQFAKGKEKTQCEEINSSMLNRITQQIKSSRDTFRVLKHLPPLNYKDMLIVHDESWFNQDIADAYNRWNRQYGMNINIDDDDTDKNNIWKISLLIRDEFRKIEPDENKVLFSLVYDLYGKPTTRTKSLLWYVYGEELYNNILFNVGQRNICPRCGNPHKEFFINNVCNECMHDNGLKLVICKDCGEYVIVKRNSNRVTRCRECQLEANKKARNDSKTRMKFRFHCENSEKSHSAQKAL